MKQETKKTIHFDKSRLQQDILSSQTESLNKDDINSTAWFEANRRLIAKSIGELFFEELIKPQAFESEKNHDITKTSQKINRRYKFSLKSGVSYEFLAWESLWQHLRVDPKSLRRNDEQGLLLASDFFIDAQSELNMDDITLGQFLEEMYSTLYSDMQMLIRYNDITTDDLLLMSGNEIQNKLNGHPKILLNKGRLGWGAEDLQRYSPENAEPFQLHWLAVHKSLAQVSDIDTRKNIYQNGFLESELITRIPSSEIENYVILPVHPWQWDQVLSIQYAGEIAIRKIISLGIVGDFYRPQISIRTLSNVTHPEQPDLKLSLSILNTSAVRGIPCRYIKFAPQVSKAIEDICKKDNFLILSQTEILKDEFGVSFIHSAYNKIREAPYKYKESLGAVWRESVSSKLKDDELAILTGSLFFQDKNKKSLIGSYIQKSGLTTAEWLRRYFEVIVLPLYHLQIKYGLGLVAHGQNIILKLKNFVPAGMFLKDFQGDLRITQDTHLLSHELDAVLIQALDKLPANYLIHDLITGHFVTVLRFISEVLFESDQFSEVDFYSILAGVVKEYVDKNNLQFKEESISLLRPTFERVLLNKVRFKIGYGESAVRPLPMVGTPLVNPLRVKEKTKGQNYES